MATEIIEHRGGRVELSRFAGGWKALVYPPGATMCEPEIPNTTNATGREETLRRAKEVLDKAIDRSF